MNAVATRIKPILDQRGQDIATLAKGADVPYHRVYMSFKRENAKPDADTLRKVADWLGVTEAFLLTGNPDPGDQADIREVTEAILQIESKERAEILAAVRVLRGGGGAEEK